MFGKAHGPRICNFACLEFQIHNGLIIVGLWGLYRSVPTSQHRSKHIGYQTLLAPPIHSSMRVQHHKSGGSWKLRGASSLVYVYVYVCVCVYVYIYIYIYIYMLFAFAFPYAYAYGYGYVYVYVYICIGKCICICKCICRCKCRCRCICICTRIRFTTYVCVSVFRYRDRCRCTRCICKGICIGMGISMKYVFCIHIEKGNKCEKMIQPTFLLCRYCARILPRWPCSEFPFAHLF